MECAYVLVYNEIRVDVVGRVFCRMRRRDTHARTYTHTHVHKYNASAICNNEMGVHESNEARTQTKQSTW